MKIALIICTYERPNSLCNLLINVQEQVFLPSQVIIVDGSISHDTKNELAKVKLSFDFEYHSVEKENRGLTKQRNYGVGLVNLDADVIAFLDDDVILQNEYFVEIKATFDLHPSAVGVGGIDLRENGYEKKLLGKRYSKFNYYELDGWITKESLRNKSRKIFGLMSSLQPDIIPDFSHGRSGFPPNEMIYEVEHLIGMSMAFKKSLFDKIKFSSYFEGYGLYEDFDFCVRALKFGNLFVNTKAQLWHYHEPSGRPNTFKYGKMVIRNGWYVWKLRFPKNSAKAVFKWHATALLLASIRLINSITGPKRVDSIKEFFGRTFGWFSLWFNRPKITK
jgi:GT2 family glycosyltransferase